MQVSDVRLHNWRQLIKLNSCKTLTSFTEQRKPVQGVDGIVQSLITCHSILNLRAYLLLAVSIAAAYSASAKTGRRCQQEISTQKAGFASEPAVYTVYFLQNPKQSHYGAVILPQYVVSVALLRENF